METMIGRRFSHLRDVVILLVARDFKGRYKHTRVGMAWSVVSPLMFLAIFYLLFTKVINLHIPRYASFVFTGILIWTWTQTALIQAVTSISANPGLVNQPGFPIAALPVVAVTSALLNLAIAFPLLLALLWIEGAPFGMAMLALPLVLAVQFIFILGMAYVVAALNVSLRDVEHVLPIVLQLGYYVTPIFFGLSTVPPAWLPFFELNPMANLLGSYRGILMDGAWPSWASLAILALASTALLVVGLRYFEGARYRFLEEL